LPTYLKKCGQLTKKKTPGDGGKAHKNPTGVRKAIKKSITEFGGRWAFRLNEKKNGGGV